MRPPDGPGGRLHRNDPGRSRPAAPSLGDALAWLDRHVNLEAIERGVAGRAAEPTLERIGALTSALGEPQLSYPVVHVTGTNGKGSTTWMCSALLEAQGLTVGTYTSPHLVEVNERIAYNAAPIGDDELAEQLGSLRELEGFVFGRSGAPTLPTWFELVTASAYRYFADVAVEAAVIEVGLGGRYDATNVAPASVAVVTNVDLDHVEILGSTRSEIAWEKAGIVKSGAVVLVGDEDPEIVEVFAQEASAVGAEALWRRGADFACLGSRIAHGGRVVDLRTPGGDYEGVFLPVHGAHQGENAAVALAAAEALFGRALDAEVVETAFAHVRLPGRLEVVARNPLVVLDGAHNAAGSLALGAALAEDFEAIDRVVVVMGCLSGRDPVALLEGIGLERVHHVVGCQPASLRALPAARIVEAAERLGLDAEPADSVFEALDRARTLAGRDDMVLVTGSLYVVGAARGALLPLSSSER